MLVFRITLSLMPSSLDGPLPNVNEMFEPRAMNPVAGAARAGAAVLPVASARNASSPRGVNFLKKSR